MTDPRVGRVIELVEAMRAYKDCYGSRWPRPSASDPWRKCQNAFEALEHDDLSNLGELPEKVQRVVDEAREYWKYWGTNIRGMSDQFYALGSAVRALDAPEPKVWKREPMGIAITCSDGRSYNMDYVKGAGANYEQMCDQMVAALNLYEREQAKKP
jgi:hypothetical protein